MKIVKFKNSKYGIRRWRLWFQFLDLKEGNYWWNDLSLGAIYCQGSLDDVKKALEIIDFKGTPIDIAKES